MSDDSLFIGRGGDDMPAPAAISVAEIAGKKFVAGLFWQPLTKPRAYKKEAQEIGKREGMDIVTIRRSTILQAGFAPKGQGAIKGMYSLSAALAAKLGNSWIGVFALNDGRYAFVAVRDGAIVPGCDAIGDRRDVAQRLNTFYGNEPWERVYVPADFDFGGEAADIEVLLANGSFSAADWREFKLQPLKFGLTARELANYAAGGLVVAGLIAAGLWYREDMIRKERNARIREAVIRKAELERIKANTKSSKEVTTIEHPWVKRPSVDDFLKGCIGRIDRIPLSLGGWLFESAECDGAQVVIKYVRKDTATTNGLLAKAKEHFDVAPTFEPSHNIATLAVPAQILYGGDDPLSPANEMLATYTSVFQALGIPADFQKREPVKPTKPATLPGQPAPPEVAVQAPDWLTFNFSFQTRIAPQVLFAGAPSGATAGRTWPGMRLTNVKADLAAEKLELNWTVTGEVYGK